MFGLEIFLQQFDVQWLLSCLFFFGSAVFIRHGFNFVDTGLSTFPSYFFLLTLHASNLQLKIICELCVSKVISSSVIFSVARHPGRPTQKFFKSLPGLILSTPQCQTNLRKLEDCSTARLVPLDRTSSVSVVFLFFFFALTRGLRHTTASLQRGKQSRRDKR